MVEHALAAHIPGAMTVGVTQLLVGEREQTLCWSVQDSNVSASLPSPARRPCCPSRSNRSFGGDKCCKAF